LAWIDGEEDQAIHRGVGLATKAAFRQFEQALRGVHKAADDDSKKADTTEQAGDLQTRLAKALLVAFPDRVAKRRHPGGDRGLMVGGVGVRVRDESLRMDAEYFLCIEALRKAGDADVRRAVAIDEQWLV